MRNHTIPAPLFLKIFMVSDFADSLRHCAHWTEGAPGSRPEKDHDDQTDQGGGQHQTVKAEAELRDPVRNCTCSIRPAPGHAEGPEQSHCLPETAGAGCYQICLKHHISKHYQKENQESIPEPAGAQPGRSQSVPGTSAAGSQLCKKLSSAAEIIAEPFIASEYGYENRYKEVDHSQPGKKYVEESKCKIKDGPDPEIIIPVSFFHTAALSFRIIHPAGQVFSHFPHPTHKSGFITA